MSMEATENFTNAIHVALKELIERKSKRDKVHFTIYQLAKAIKMPHSMLSRLIHADPAKRVHNPRIDTLAKIIDFFRGNGFNVTIDDLLGGLTRNVAIDVNHQDINVFTANRSVAVFSFEVSQPKQIGTINVKLTDNVKHAIAWMVDEEIKPMFKAGSIFIVDPELLPEHEMLVVARLDGYKKILIRKYCMEGRKIILRSFDHHVTPIELMPTMHYSLEVVVQVNART